MKRDQRERLGELLDAMKKETGPIPAELMAEARRLWQPVGSEERVDEDRGSA